MGGAWAKIGIGLALTALAGAGQSPPPTSTSELRAALDGLRTRRLQGDALEDALRHLPKLIASESAFFADAGAFLAGEYGRAECVPALRRALARTPPPGQDVDSRSTLLIFDALIRLDARVDAKLVLDRVNRELAIPAYLLFARGETPDVDGLAALAERGWQDSPAHWCARYTLALHGDPRGARGLWFDAPWHWDVEWNEGGHLGGEMQGVSRGSTAHKVWPPRILYRVHWDDGAEPRARISHLRTTHSRSWTNPVPLNQRARAEWRLCALEDLFGSEVVEPLRPRVIALHGPAATGASLRERLTDELAALRRAVNSCLRASLGEAAIGTPSVELTLHAFGISATLHETQPRASKPR